MVNAQRTKILHATGRMLMFTLTLTFANFFAVNKTFFFACLLACLPHTLGGLNCQMCGLY